MGIRQTRVFVPNNGPYASSSAWAETLMGRVIQPLLDGHPEVEWFWFSRYVAPRTDSGDCAIDVVPEEFEVVLGKDRLLRSLRFRYQIPDAYRQAFEDDGRRMIAAEGCVISDWRDYDLLEDLGGPRFVGEDRSPARAAKRAQLVVACLKSISEIVLDSLVGPDIQGAFRIERNDNTQNPFGSSFESLHHMVCNITDVPLGVNVWVGTDWHAPLSMGRGVLMVKY